MPAIISFQEISPQLIIKEYPKYFHKLARYFQVINDKCNLCIYGLISYNESIAEAFLVIDSFKGKVFTVDFFPSFFNHMSNIGFKEIYSWTKWKKLIRTLEHCKKFGVEKTDSPSWDNDPSKTWFVKRS